MPRDVPFVAATLAAAAAVAVGVLLVGCTAPDGADGSDGADGVGSTAYDRCPDALVDAWLELGRDDDRNAAALDRVPNGPGDLPTDEVRVLCSVALASPEGGAAFTLSVLEGPGSVAEIVGAVAAERGFVEEPSPHPGAALALVSADGSTRYELSLPADEVLTASDFPNASTSFLLEGTIAR